MGDVKISFPTHPFIDGKSEHFQRLQINFCKQGSVYDKFMLSQVNMKHVNTLELYLNQIIIESSCPDEDYWFQGENDVKEFQKWL